MIDRSSFRLRYFHNAGYHELADADYHGVLRTTPDEAVLPPYAELVNLDRLHMPDERALRDKVAELVTDHLSRRPTTNPVERLGRRILTDVSWLQQNGEELFHAYAFGTLRQCGAWAETAASFVAWLNPRASTSADSFATLAAEAKTCQFKLARIASGRISDLSPLLTSMAQHWDDAYRSLLAEHG